MSRDELIALVGEQAQRISAQDARIAAQDGQNHHVGHPGRGADGSAGGPCDSHSPDAAIKISTNIYILLPAVSAAAHRSADDPGRVGETVRIGSGIVQPHVGA